jgi:hypothetical protein
MRSLTCVLLLLTVFSLIAVSTAQQSSTTAIPDLINYSGTLVLPSRPGVPAKVVGVTFAIYRQEDGGAPLWLETQNVMPDSTGHYSVLLGSTRAEGIPVDLFSTQEQRWLGVQMQGEVEQSRVLLVSVPYAMKAGDAETVGGMPLSAFMLKPPSSEPTKETGNVAGVMAPALAGQIGGGGTTNYIPIWTSTTNLGNSTIYETGGNVGIGTTAPTSMLTVAGSLSGSSVNASTAYQINGTSVLSTSGTQNLFLGQHAGQHNVSGVQNTFSGNQAGTSNTTGNENAFFGNQAGQFNVSGRSNTFLGPGAGRNNTSGNDNTFLGARGGLSNTTGSNNTFAGFVAGYHNTTGSQNVFLGNGAGQANTSGQNNTFIGWTSGTSNVSGTDNVYVGYTSGEHATGSNNIYLGEISSTLNESNTIRIGSNQSATYIQGVINGNGAGLTGVVPGAGSPYYIQNGAAQQTNANFNISGNGSASSFNSATTYQISGTSVLSIGSPTDRSVFLGVGAGANNISGQGVYNTFAGYQAGYGNTSGNSNTFYGYQAGLSNSTGSENTFSGLQAGYNNTTGSGNSFFGIQAGWSNTTGPGNTFVGNSAGFSNTTGFGNTFSGVASGERNTTGSGNTFSGFQAGTSNAGSNNTFSGYDAGYYNTTGIENTFSGYQAGYNNTTGSYNTFSGYLAGINNFTGSYDVYISTQGPLSGTESNTIRLGDPSLQTSVYVAGIYGTTASGGIPVYINSNGQLGTLISSRRFKEQIRDMGDSSTALMKLRPVTFLYKPEYDKGERTLQYGLIAEEVAEVYPDLVAYGPDGKPYTVKYQYLTTILLNEVQKQYRRAEDEAEVIKSQDQKIEDLEQRLSRLERLVTNQETVIAQK